MSDEPKCTTHHYACDCREWMFAKLRAERDEAILLLQEVFLWSAKYRYSSVTPRYKGGSDDKMYDKIDAFLARMEVK